jgi:hypothetical protein
VSVRSEGGGPAQEGISIATDASIHSLLVTMSETIEHSIFNLLKRAFHGSDADISPEKNSLELGSEFL